MYKQINNMVPVYEKYASELIAEGSLTKAEKLNAESRNQEILQEAFLKSREQNLESMTWNHYAWENIREVQVDPRTPKGQGINSAYARELLEKITTIPNDFTINP